MAQLDIDIKVNGEEKLKELDKLLDGITQKTVNFDKAILGMGTALAGLSYAFSEVNALAQEWEDKLEAVGEATDDFTYKQGEANVALEQASHGLISAIKSTDLYKNAVDLTVETIDGWTSIFTGKTIEAVARTRVEIEKKTDALEDNKKALKEHQKTLKEQAKAQDEATKALARYNGVQELKVRAHKEEIAIIQELIYIYEEQGRNTDELIAKLERLEATDVLATKTIREKAEAIAEATKETQENSQAVEENTTSVDENTETLEENTRATEEASRANQTFSSSGETISGAEAYSKYALGLDMSQPTSDMERYLREIAESSRDTNDAVRGY